MKCGSRRNQISRELLLHLYPWIKKELLSLEQKEWGELNLFWQDSWLLSPPLVSVLYSNSVLWQPVQASPKTCLTWCDCPPAGAARTGWVPNYHKLNMEAPVLSICQEWQQRHMLTQNLQAVLVHQHNLWEVISEMWNFVATLSLIK